MKIIDVTNDGLAFGILLFAFLCLLVAGGLAWHGDTDSSIMVSLVGLANAAIGGVLGYIRGNKPSEGGDVNNE